MGWKIASLSTLDQIDKRLMIAIECWRGVLICAAVHNPYCFYKSLEAFGRVNMVRNLDLKVKHSVCQRGQILIGN